MAILLKEMYNNFFNSLKDTGENKIFYYGEGGKYIEYTEGYNFRDGDFKDRVDEIIKKPYFEKVFLIILSAVFSSSNEIQFLDLLDRYLSVFFAKKFLKEGEDLIEKKTYFRAHLNFIGDDYLKNKLLIEGWDWRKYENSALKLKNNRSVYTIVEHVYEIVEKEILDKFDL